MRIWSINPKYLDGKGIVALWRETLLAKKVLEGKTKGYRKHSQLFRFKNAYDPLLAINFYLYVVYNESLKRGYYFDCEKFRFSSYILELEKITLTSHQIEYEFIHFLNKLKKRNYQHYKKLENIEIIEAHPLFNIIEGDIEFWEKVKNYNINNDL